MAVSTLMEEMSWDIYGSPNIHTPVVKTNVDCHKLDLLTNILGTLTRMMDTRLTFVTTEGKIIKEWVERMLEIGGRYRRELELLEELERKKRL
jgi:hypothetical protein